MDRSKNIDRLLKPRSVAVVGASDKPGALGSSMLANLERNGFDGAIYPVNPKRSEIGGRKCFAGIEDLPEGVDCAVLAIPRAGILPALKGLAERGVGAAVIFSAGFAEDGEEGLAEQREIAEIAARHGIVVEGPNCLGCVNHVDKVPLTFVETECRPPEGRGIAVVSQSGAMAAVLATMLQSRELGISYTVSTGNEAASGVEDYLEWLIDDAHTKIVAMIVEHFRKPQAFLQVVERLRAAGKEVVLLHPGRSSAARESAATHTGAMAGDYKVMRAKVEQAGVIMAETLEELADVSEIAVRSSALPEAGAAVLGESGAFKALTLDLSEELNLALAGLADADSPALRAALPEFVPVSNPLDITAMGLSQPRIYTETIAALLADKRVGAILVGLIQTDPTTCALKFPAVLEALEGGEGGKTVVFAGLDEGAEVPREWLARLRAAGIACFPSTERALRAIARLTHRRRPGGDTAIDPMPLAQLESGTIPEYRAKQVLASAGIAFPEGRFAASADEAVAAAAALGGRVAMKAQAAALGHKSDAGGVRLALEGEAAVREAWATMHEAVAGYDASIVLDGVLIEAMGRPGTEMIVGAKRDAEWGPVVLVGFGGVTAEVLGDVTLITPGQGAEAIAEAIHGLAQAPLLRGFRGSAPRDVAALARLVETVGKVMQGNDRILEIDLNPVMLYEEGKGLSVLDALMLVA
ncbi:acetate--CoA ligase family protein [Novosphingobium pentaromativorans]|uniref:CoA-binding protein n=1 Tax=Novosphingobium pentaromativorans US6-1 TaxID=1088721 RepID=G6EER8_9SPHN|nr:acetate--CoA ligase family protein [Novosphingobium pentaromativorans]AIT79350.1 CoA-binding protein [Novosphingobium pentaromativorans US6-1]EHJ60214.1 CoA-binding protein [Novosphingobium pentaromativorans US6-1]